MIIRATTPEETLKAIVLHLQNQATQSRIDSRIAERKTVQKQKQFQADVYENLAKFFEGVKIEHG
jgi:hypothetical protein